MKRKFLALILLAGSLLGSTALAQVKNDEGVVMAPVVFDDKIEFWAELTEEGNVYMDWSKFDRNEEFTYYKIVRSKDNPNPVYPDDGYIFYSDDKNLLSYTDTDVPGGTSYYRICQISGNKRYCSVEVRKIVKKLTLSADSLALQPIRSNLKLSDINKAAIANELATAESTQAEIPAISNLSPAAQEEFNKLPLAMQNLIRKKLNSGEEFTKDELLKLPQVLRAEIVAISDKSRLVRTPVQTAGSGTAAKGTSVESFISEYWVQFLALIVSLIGVFLAVTGFTIAGAKKKKSVSKFINDIDDTFASFKWKSKRCEAELYRLQDLIEDKLKAGKIDESSYHLLMNRIEKYLKEIKEVDGNPGEKTK